MIDPVPDTFSARLLALRSQAGLSPAELARRAGISRAVYSRMESGQRKPSFDTLQKIARALNCSLSVFDHCQ